MSETIPGCIERRSPLIEIRPSNMRGEPDGPSFLTRQKTRFLTNKAHRPFERCAYELGSVMLS